MRIRPAGVPDIGETDLGGRRRQNELRSYLDAKKRPYIHLLDGGLADNIGMRSVLELAELVEDLESSFQVLGVKTIRKLVYLMVSAETDPDVSQYKLDEIPSLTRVLNALIDIPINRYSDDTFELMGLAVTQMAGTTSPARTDRYECLHARRRHLLSSTSVCRS